MKRWYFCIIFLLHADELKKYLLFNFLNGGPYYIETSLLICSANQWTGFYMIGTSVIKELNILTYEKSLHNLVR